MKVLNIEKITESLAIIFGETFCKELIVRYIRETAFQASYEDFLGTWYVSGTLWAPYNVGASAPEEYGASIFIPFNGGYFDDELEMVTSSRKNGFGLRPVMK